MRLIDADYLYNKLVANKCPYDLVLQMVKDEPTVCDIEQIRAAITFQRYALERGEEVLYRGGYNDGIDTALDIIDHYTK